MAATVVETRVEFHRKVLFLRDGQQRYKVLYGGRAGIKSWSIARALLLNGSERPLRILCARETMESISQSVHQLLRDQIEMMQFSDCYEVLKASIAGKPGTSAAGTRAVVLEFHEALEREGALAERSTRQPWSSADGRFLPDRYVVGTCPKCGMFLEKKG